MKNIERKVILMVMILVILLGFITYFYIQAKKNKDFYQIKNEVYEEMKNELIMPTGVFQFKKNYDGENDVKDFYRSVYSLSRWIIDVSKVKEKRVDKYYEKNKDSIKQNYGITSLEDFKKIKNYIASFDKIKGYNSAKIDTDSIKNTKECIEFDMTLVYDGTKELKFHVQFMNSDSKKILVKYKLAE